MSRLPASILKKTTFDQDFRIFRKFRTNGKKKELKQAKHVVLPPDLDELLVKPTPIETYFDLEQNYIDFDSTPGKYWRDPIAEAKLRRDFYIYHMQVPIDRYEEFSKNDKIIEPPPKPIKANARGPFKRAKINIIRVMLDSKSKKKTKHRVKKYLSLAKYHKKKSESSSSDFSDEVEDADTAAYTVIDDTTAPVAADVVQIIHEDKSGVKITEIFNGQLCDECPEVCTGFSPHSWRIMTIFDRIPSLQGCAGRSSQETTNPNPDDGKRLTPKFPSRERHYAVRRPRRPDINNNNTAYSHTQPPSCVAPTHKPTTDYKS